MLNRRYVGRAADRSVFAEVAREAENHPARVALVVRPGTVLTYAELVDQAWHDAVRLAAVGVTAGARVVLLCENRPDWLRSYLALSAANAQTVPLGDDATELDLRAALEDRPHALIGSADALSRLSPELRADLLAAGVLLLDFDARPPV
jgi:long-subunit acyl-CoA synthetase (AMP-forming)